MGSQYKTDLSDMPFLAQEAMDGYAPCTLDA